MHVSSPPPPPPTPSGFIVGQQQGQIQSQQGHLNLDILPQVQGQCSNVSLQPLHQHPSQGQLQVQSHVSRQFTVTSVQPEQKQLDFIPQQCSNLQGSNVLLQPMHQQLSQSHIQVPGQQHPYGNLLEQQGQQPPQLGLSSKGQQPPQVQGQGQQPPQLGPPGQGQQPPEVQSQGQQPPQLGPPCQGQQPPQIQGQGQQPP